MRGKRLWIAALLLALVVELSPIPVLASGLRRADQLAVALESRGFGKEKKRTLLSKFPVTWRDGIMVSTVGLVGILMGTPWVM